MTQIFREWMLPPPGKSLTFLPNATNETQQTHLVARQRSKRRSCTARALAPAHPSCPFLDPDRSPIEDLCIFFQFQHRGVPACRPRGTTCGTARSATKRSSNQRPQTRDFIYDA